MGSKVRQQHFMSFALMLSEESKCEELNVAAVITNNDMDQVYSIGVNGGPKGLQDCLCVTDGKYGCIHAEINALCKCKTTDTDLVMFVTLAPCKQCAAAMINNNIKTVYYHKDWKEDAGIKLLRAANVSIHKI